MFPDGLVELARLRYSVNERFAYDDLEPDAQEWFVDSTTRLIFRFHPELRES